MPYSLDSKPKHTKQPWSDEALERELKHIFKRHSLADLEHMLNPARTADDLNHTLSMLKKHLGVKSHKVRAAFSDQIVEAGYCQVSNKKCVIYVNAAHAGKPFKCAAILAHNLCHFVLIELHKIIFEDNGENEKAADRASIVAGLGLVVLSGTAPIGWRRIFYGWTKKRRSLLGYYPLAAYAELLSDHLNSHHLTPLEIARSSTTWNNYWLKPALRYKGRLRTSFMRSTYSRDRLSVHHFWLNSFTMLLFCLTIVYVLLQRPVVLSDELRQQKAKLNALASSYYGCAERVEKANQTYGETDSQIQRYIDSERTACKSLQNQYNHEINVYNKMKSRY